jgi:hypothetical protein
MTVALGPREHRIGGPSLLLRRRERVAFQARDGNYLEVDKLRQRGNDTIWLSKLAR